MTEMFVLDNSVAMRWLMPTQDRANQQYAEEVLLNMNETVALVPSLWYLEASNTLLTAEKKGEITTGQTEAFSWQLENLPISVDSSAWTQLGRTMALGRAYNLSSYDAAYLELAIRKSVKLASLDKALIKAAKNSGVGIHLKGETGK